MDKQEKLGWLVNDCLTCIPGTKTFWHDLLEGIPNLKDMTFGHTHYNLLPSLVENSTPIPEYIIRNASYFRNLNLKVKTISLLQDIMNDPIQLDVCNKSDVVVFNSNYVKSKYEGKINSMCEVIPLGVDSTTFIPSSHLNQLLPNSILFVGASTNYPKGFDTILNLIQNTNYNFGLVMKDDFKLSHPRVRVFNRLPHKDLVPLYNECSILLCTSREETQHLVSVEAGFCNKPVITTNVGIHYNRDSGPWGINLKDMEILTAIDYALNNLYKFSPREFLLKEGLDKKVGISKWKSVIGSL